MLSKSGKHFCLISLIVVYLFSIELTVTAGLTCHPVDQCTCKTQDGKFVSLWDVDKRFEVGDEEQRTGFSYVLRPCTAFTDANSQCKNVLGCQTTGSTTSDLFAIAYKPATVTTSYDAQGQLHFIYTGSTDAQTGTQRQTDITLKCDPTAVTPSMDSVLESPSFNYKTTLTSQCACPGKCHYTPSNTGSKKKGLSTGSVLCIILLVLVVVYLIGGMVIYKYALHKEGWDIIPLRTFWKDFPLLVKDGAVFTYRKVTGKKGEYQELS